MRWPAKRQPSAGDTRWVRRFALWPTQVGYKWVWLEHFEEHQQYIHMVPHYVGWMRTRRRVLA